jgi:hypothetical protein
VKYYQSVLIVAFGVSIEMPACGNYSGQRHLCLRSGSTCKRFDGFNRCHDSIDLSLQVLYFCKNTDGNNSFVKPALTAWPKPIMI